MMPVLFLSTNPETQNLEDCLPKFIVYLPSLSFQRIDKKHLFEHFGFLSALSNTKEKHAFTLKSPETSTPHSEILSLHLYTTNSLIMNTVRNGQMTKGIMQEKNSDVMKMMTMISFWSFEGKMTRSTRKTWNFQISKSTNE